MWFLALGAIGLVVLLTRKSSAAAPPVSPPAAPATDWISPPSGWSDSAKFSRVIELAAAEGVPLYADFFIRRASAPTKPAATDGGDFSVYSDVIKHGVDESGLRYFDVRIRAYGETAPSDVPEIGRIVRLNDMNLVSMSRGLKKAGNESDWKKI